MIWIELNRVRGLSKSVDRGIDERQECRRKFDALIDG